MSGEPTGVLDQEFRHTVGMVEDLERVHLTVCTTCGNAHHHRADCPLCRLVAILEPTGAFEYLDEDWGAGSG